jgi:septal ring factor EnvC (AmiA/AmiB activator)
MLTKTKIKSIIRGIDKHMIKIAQDRDKLDEFISDLNSLKEDCDSAYDALIDARDALSRMV